MNYYCPKHGEHKELKTCPRCDNCKHDYIFVWIRTFNKDRADSKICTKCGAGKILREDKFVIKVKN